MSCGVGRRRSWDLVLLWLWHRPAAIAPIQTLAWEPPYAASVAPKKERERGGDAGISLVAQRVKDPALSLQWLGLVLWHEFSPQPGKFHMPRA